MLSFSSACIAMKQTRVACSRTLHTRKFLRVFASRRKLIDWPNEHQMRCTSVAQSHLPIETRRYVNFTPVYMDKSTSVQQKKDRNGQNPGDAWFTVPNVISGLRLCSSPIVVYFVVQEQVWAAAALFGISAISDWLDGVIARKWESQRSNIGTILDPLADKVLVCSTAVALTWVGSIPALVTAAYFAKDGALVLASIYVRIKALRKHGYDIGRFFDSSVVRIEVRPSVIGKFNTLLQLLVLSGALASPIYTACVPSSSLMPLVHTMAYCSVLTTAAAALSYTSGLGYKIQ